MDNQAIYIKRMEAAVLQAGAAINKLKVENAALKKENEELKRKRDSTDYAAECSEHVAKHPRTTAVAVSTVQTVSVSKTTTTPAKTAAVAASLIAANRVQPSTTTVASISKENVSCVLPALVKQSSRANALNASTSSYNQIRAGVMSAWSGGEGLSILKEPENETDSTKAENSTTIRAIEVTKTPHSEPSSVPKKTATPTDPKATGNNTIIVNATEITSPGNKKSKRSMQERGWECSFTAGSYSD